MNKAEVTLLLGKAAAFDTRRRVGEAEVEAWYEVVHDIPFVSAMAAVTRHFAESDQWLMPVHVLTLAEQIGRWSPDEPPPCPRCHVTGTAVAGTVTGGYDHSLECTLEGLAPVWRSDQYGRFNWDNWDYPSGGPAQVTA